MNRATDHLTSAQIEEYVSKGHAVAGGAYKGLEAHMEDCEPCLGRVLNAHRMHLGLLEGDRMTKTRYPNCPAESALQELAAGISPPEIAEATAQHAAHCGSCGPLLSRYLKEFSDNLETEDAAILKQLETSKPGWQKKFVREQIGRSQETPERSFFARLWPSFATAAAAAAMAWVGIFVWVHRSNDLTQAQQLVASAYAERRTTEMRLPAAPYGKFSPIPVVKGSSDAGDWSSKPASLVEAEGLVRRKNINGTVNPQWLEVQGRIDLLEGSPKGIDRAIESLEKALAADSQNPAIKVDLATALFEKEMRADHEPAVLARTIDLLADIGNDSSQAPEEVRKAALFNLALAYEKSEMRDRAISTWEQYLQLDRTSPWSKEAQQHLDDLRNHAPPPRQQGYATPAYFLSHSSDPDVLANLEEFQDIAVRTWLPTVMKEPSGESAHAAAQLAQLLKKYHSDPWLLDLLHQSQAADASPITMLSEASTYDLNDLHFQAIRKSKSAIEIFQSHHNVAGELRARFQEVYGLQRSLAADDCIEQINQLWPRVFATEYRWLQGQLALEKATCANLNLDFPAASRYVSTSRQIAREFHFPELLLRVAGFEPGIQRSQENYDAAWAQAVVGLRLYWQGQCAAVEKPVSFSASCPYSWERLYQFYSVMQQCTRKMGLPRASSALLDQGLAILEKNAPDDITLRAMLYLRLANALLRQDEKKKAESTAAQAESLLKQIPTHDQTGQLYAAMTRIDLAEFYVEGGDPKSALQKIEPVREFLSGQDDLIKLDFYTAEGEIYREMGRLEDAISSDNSAIQVAEGGAQDDVSRPNWILATGKAYRGLTRCLLQLGHTQEALSVWEWFLRRSLNTSTRAAIERSPDLTNSFPYPQLPSVPDTHLIYASFPDGMQIWIVRGRNIESKWVAIQREKLESEVTEFKKECANRSQSIEHNQPLYSSLIQPVLASLPTSGAIALELDEPLWGLAFAALKDSEGRYFSDNHAIVYSPGILAEANLRSARSLNRHGAMLLVDASQSDGLPLPGHRDEVNAVSSAFGRTTVLGPDGITPDAVKQMLPKNTEFHFTGHGKPDSTGTALMIGPDVFLRAKDLSPQYLKHLELAVLSACSSGSAKNWVFDQSNLVRSFLSGGVPIVIASQWEVDSKSTAQFMQSFYGHMKMGKTAAQALQYAQTEMRSANIHPYYWAAFTLAGRVN